MKTLASSADPRTRPISVPSLTRDPVTGAFPTAALASIIEKATNEPAHPFGARCIPAVMRVVEMMGIEQSRRWGVGGINELRKTLGLKGLFCSHGRM